MSELFSFLRPSFHVPQKVRELVYITNILSVILSLLTAILFLILYKLFGWTSTSPYILSVAVFFFVSVFVNIRFYDIGRLLFCLTPIWMTMFVSLYGKSIATGQSYITYFDSRYILIATTILPAVVFRLDERLKITFCLASTLLCLVLFDPIHNALGLGYYQRGFTAPSYYYINYISVTAYFILLFGIITLKTITERAQMKADKSIVEKESINATLLEKNLELSRLNFDIEARNEEMQQQQEELAAGRDKLEEANQLINVQKDELSLFNTQLQLLVDEKSKNLSSANEELVKHNSELRQFSYTVSHNLRGPVARLLGLSQMFNMDNSEEARRQIVSYIQQSTQDLDVILKDLSMIIDIRNQLYTIREKISLDEEWKKVGGSLVDEIKPDYSIEVDFSAATHVFAIRPMVHSILYNLFSNAIKYQSPDRLLRITVRSYVDDQERTIFEVKDNGLGIDLARQRENVFKLYRRFHPHIGGKGLGLFIVKTQVGMMDGTIEIESELNKGTLFRITLPKPKEIERQVLLEVEAADLHFDAELNTTVINWKRNISSAEYHTVFDTILQTIKNYNTPSWIADLRHQGKIGDEDQIWFVSKVLPEAVRTGLKRVVTVGFTDPSRKIYLDRMKEVTAQLGLDFFVCQSMDEARDVVKSFQFRRTS
ncbi:MAG: sensor histidine kinase [Cyclobacteriaceae bacterium]